MFVGTIYVLFVWSCLRLPNVVYLYEWIVLVGRCRARHIEEHIKRGVIGPNTRFSLLNDSMCCSTPPFAGGRESAVWPIYEGVPYLVEPRRFLMRRNRQC